MDSKSTTIDNDQMDRLLYFVAGFPFKLYPLRDIEQFYHLDSSIKFNCKRYMFPRAINYNQQNQSIYDIFNYKKFNSQLIDDLKEEIKKDYIRSNHKFEFNMSLPYNDERQKLFKGLLPDHLFNSIIDIPRKETNRLGLIDSGYQDYKRNGFLKLFTKMKKQIHLADPKRLLILQELNTHLLAYEKIPLIINTFKYSVELHDFKKTLDNRYQDRLREIRSQIYDSNFQLMDMVDKEERAVKERNEQLLRTVVIEEQKKALQELKLDPEIIISLANFQGIINILYEKTLRNALVYSVQLLCDYFIPTNRRFRKVNQMDEDFAITETSINYEQVLLFQRDCQFDDIKDKRFCGKLKLEIENDQLCIKPPISEWKSFFSSILSSIMNEMSLIPCLKTRDIGNARKNEKMKIVNEDDFEISILLEQSQTLIDQVFVLSQIFQKSIKDLNFIIDFTNNDRKKIEKYKSFNEFEKQILKMKQISNDLQKYLFQDNLTLGIFQINCQEVRESLQSQIKKSVDLLYKFLIARINKENQSMEQEMQSIAKRLEEEPETIEAMDALRIFCNQTLPEELQKQKQKIDQIMEKLDLLEVFFVEINEEDFHKTWSIYGMPLLIHLKKDECLQRLKNLEIKMNEGLIWQQQNQIEEIKELRRQFDSLSREQDVTTTKETSGLFNDLDIRIRTAIHEAEVINNREKILKWKISDYTILDVIYKDFIPYNKVWQISNDFQLILNTIDGPLNAIDREQLTDDVLSSWQELVKLEKNIFKNIPHMKFVSQKVRKPYESFKINLPLINDLRNPHLRPNHWQRMNQAIEKYNSEVQGDNPKVEKSFDEEQVISFKELLEGNIMLAKEQIRDISEIATKERTFEKQIQVMKNQWKPIKLELILYKDTETYTLKNVDPITDKLDEDIAKILSIASSPYIKFMEKEVIIWRDTLFRLQETIELWLKVQKMWQYLQPIFYSEDIIREMQTEGNKYSFVDKYWRSIMQNAQLQPNVMDACFQSRQRETFILMIQNLEQVIKGLNDYLNKKRSAFPRFYFLSNDELLSILAQTREPRAVQRHLPKCFEGIDTLTFREDSKITQMNSIDGEIIQFSNSIDPLDKSQNPRGVELWLTEIEKMMKLTLSEQYVQTVTDFAKCKRNIWLLKWPSQLVVLADQNLWTANVTTSLEKQSKDDPESLKKCFKQNVNNLQQIVDMVRGDLSKIHRITLGVLVVIEVHAKDVVQELIDNEVMNSNAFEWLQHMRYYLEGQNVIVKMVNADRKYGFEYLGNQGRLVITPLTDRCYRTLMSALQQFLGGAPEGPAGTGKTETTKDLAKAIAKHCVVFNCSDSLDYQAMGKFFKGLVSCGSWACFDEFNRIELEVLSVIASQILTIQQSIIKISMSKAKDKSTFTFFFEGTDIAFDISCGIFITMNPGYQGRSELPDNLKALFRPVAMMIPIYAMICEISLYSYGFMNARDLSIKITVSLKLASEQLSTQSHYDFGMRAIKSIILAAGTFKRDFPDQDEAFLVLRAISDCNLPKFTSKDVPLFEAIISDLFPSIQKKQESYGELDKSIKQIIQEKNLTYSERFYRKIIELYDTFQVRHGLMVVGQTNSGKTTIVKTLQLAIDMKNVNKSLNKQQQSPPIKGIKEEDEEDDEMNSEDEKKQQKLTEFLKPKQEAEPQIIDYKKSASIVVKGAPERRQSILDNKMLLKEIEYQKVNIHQLNPKSVTPKLLFGDFDDAGEWHDGITPKLFRECNEDKSINLNWIFFDGPVDALWIENMNTVLDDNKKLCMANGETIKLTDKMSIVFEVEDLLEASPATVSRCGMVYLESKDLQWDAFFDQWFDQLTYNHQTVKHSKFFKYLIETFLTPIFKLVYSEQVKQAFLVTQFWLAFNFFKIFECFLCKGKTKNEVLDFLERDREKEQAKIDAARLEGQVIQVKDERFPLQDKDKGEITSLFIMALTWSCGVILDDIGRKIYENKVKSILKEFVAQELVAKWLTTNFLPSDDLSIFETFFDCDKKLWSLWKQGPEYRVPKDVKSFHDIFIPTADSIRHNHVLSILLKNNYPCLFVGKTGTGKTIITKKFLINDLEVLGNYRITITAFSANTSCSQVQDVLESKLEKQKRRKGVYGPLIGTTNIIFIDDMNMPTKEKYGAQPPLELIRQWFSYGGWYDRKTLEFNKIVDINFTSSMGLGRAPISNRLLRQFNIIYLNDMEEQTLSDIVSKILEWGYSDYVDKIKFMIKSLKTAITEVHSMVSKQFLPLPAKSHYLFNLRDLMKVVQGVMAVPADQYNAQADCKSQLLRLYIYESMCVYSDRLVDEQDKSIFMNILQSTIDNVFSIDMGKDLLWIEKEGVKTKATMMYVNFLENKVYHEIDNIKKIKDAAQDSIDAYNQNSKKKIGIVLFEDALHMLCKINRIISNPFGHCLNIGLGGSGSHTLTKLATYMQDFKLFELDMDKEFGTNDWLEFIRDLLRDIVMQDNGGTFLISDSQLINEKFLEDINNLLNIGEIPNLFIGDDKESMLLDMKDKHKLSISGMPLLWEYFVHKCKSNLHIVLCLTPIGDKLRQRLRNFPSLISCTSPIWIRPWSKEALNEVAHSTLIESADELQLEEQMIDKISQICLNFHYTVQEITHDYFKETGRHYYVTPISYMKLLKNFKNIYQDKLNVLVNQKETYSNGVTKLDLCSEMVQKMEIELQALQPELKVKTLETEEIMKKVEIENELAEKQRDNVKIDEIETTKQQENAAQIAAQCKSALSVAEPKLKEAMEALKTLQQKDFVEMKSFQKPPALIKLTMDAVCILMAQKGKKGEKGVIEYWDDARKLLSDPNGFIKKLEKFDKDNLSENIIQKMKDFLEKNGKQFTPQNIQKASIASEGLCKWCLAIYEYYFVHKSILPLRSDLAEATKKLELANKELQKKRDLLNEVEQRIQGLRDLFENTNLQKQKLIAQIKECELKLERASSLTNGLSGEKKRWSKNADTLKIEITNLLGDILLAIGCISYLGAFTGEYRKRIIFQNWVPIVNEQQIVCNPEFSLIQRIGDPMEIQDWIIHGLPLDEVSQENAIIMKISDNWPLLIDPQNQAKKFIKMMETKSTELKFQVAKPGKQLEKCLQIGVQNGQTILVDGCQEQLDTVLDTVLIKSNIQIQAGSKIITIGSSTIHYNNDFRLYLICNLPNPHYTPEVLTKVTLLNFTITPEGAKDQMLSILCKEEDETLEKEKNQITIDSVENQKNQNSIEKSILQLLANTEGSKILESDQLIEILAESKKLSQQIEERRREAKITEDRVIQMKINLEPVANMASQIYFCVLALENLDPMYQFSLEFFVRVYKKSIKQAEKVAKNKVDIRVKNLQESLKRCIYFEMNRSIFVKHKLLFSLQLTITCLKVQERFDQELYSFMISGLSGKGLQQIDNPDKDTFSQKQWNNILHLDNTNAFQGLVYDILTNVNLYVNYIKNLQDTIKLIFDGTSENPNDQIPEKMRQISKFSKLVFVKALRPELFVNTMKWFISEEIGPYFIDNLIITLEESYIETESHIPIIFILSPGDDPQDELKTFSQEKGQYIANVSLGKGQGEFAEKSIREAMKGGSWALLQNCHLAVSWLGRLEEIVEEIQLNLNKKDIPKENQINPQFRLFLTSMSSDQFPMNLLQQGIKMTKDPPKGVISNVLQLYTVQNSTKNEKKFFETCTKGNEWRSLYMSLTFFHAIIRERRRFGPIGWNIFYDFNESDFRISMRQLKQMLEDYDEIPFKALNYLTGECNYGGRVTDDWDRRVLKVLLKDFYNKKVPKGDYCFSKILEYKIPEKDLIIDIDQSISYLQQLQDISNPELFGLHQNAAISSATFECQFMISCQMSLGQKKTGGGSAQSSVIMERSLQLLENLPNDFDVPTVSEKYQLNYYESMNTVLIQEILRYNTLLNLQRNSLKDLIAALQGLKIMTNDLENLQESITNNVIPNYWLNKSYPSLKPLISYHQDLQKRIQTFNNWIENGNPNVFWLPGFYFTQSFFSGVKQQYSRKKQIPIDEIEFEIQIRDDLTLKTPQAEIGCFVQGVFIEGARWNNQKHIIDESLPEQIFEQMPIIWFIPVRNSKGQQNNTYKCPLYKTTERKGTLSTTGHSTNFILSLDLPTLLPEEHWVKRGVAIVTQLND